MSIYDHSAALVYVRARKKMYWELYQDNGYRPTAYCFYKMFLFYLKTEDKMLETHPHLFPKPRYEHAQ